MKAGVYYSTYGHWTQSLLNAGYDVLWHWQPNIVDKSKINLVSQDIHTKNFPNIPFAIGETPDIICGSPPCIGLSKANPNASPTHEANRHIISFAKQVAHMKPQYFLMEMVPGLLTAKDLLQEYMNILHEYSIEQKVFDCSKYGAACIRKRLYLFGSRFDKTNALETLKQIPHANVVDIIGHLETTTNVNDKTEVYDHSGRKGIFGAIEKMNMILCPDGVMYTIVGGSTRAVFHYNRKRLISVTECKLLMGFPEAYYIPQSNLSQKTVIIASGVDIRFTTYLLKHIAEYLKVPEHVS